MALYGLFGCVISSVPRLTCSLSPSNQSNLPSMMGRLVQNGAVNCRIRGPRAQFWDNGKSHNTTGPNFAAKPFVIFLNHLNVDQTSHRSNATAHTRKVNQRRYICRMYRSGVGVGEAFRLIAFAALRFSFFLPVRRSRAESESNIGKLKTDRTETDTNNAACQKAVPR